MARGRDDHGQPLARGLNSIRVTDRIIDDLMGICRGVVADGVITDSEAHYLLEWLETNREAADQWPGRDLYRRVREMLVDRTLSTDEQGELLDVLLGITGEKGTVGDRVAAYSTTLPLCVPAPKVLFTGKLFCLTGRFAFGTRRQCEEAVVSKGGEAQGGPTRSTSYVVIGAMGSRDWIHSSFGRKIQAAVELREKGLPVHIVSEEHWVKALD